MPQPNKSAKRLAHEIARIRSITYSAALREVMSTPSAVAADVIFQPVRDIEADRRPVCVAHADQVEAIRADLFATGLSEVAVIDPAVSGVTLARLALQTCRSNGVAALVVDNTPGCSFSRSAFGSLLDDALVITPRTLPSIRISDDPRVPAIDFSRQPIFVDGVGRDRLVSFLGSELRRLGSEIASDPVIARERLYDFDDERDVTPLVFLADGESSDLAAEITRFGLPHVGVLCVDVDAAPRCTSARRPGVRVTLDDDTVTVAVAGGSDPVSGPAVDDLCSRRGGEATTMVDLHVTGRLADGTSVETTVSVASIEDAPIAYRRYPYGETEWTVRHLDAQHYLRVPFAPFDAPVVEGAIDMTHADFLHESRERWVEEVNDRMRDLVLIGGHLNMPVPTMVYRLDLARDVKGETAIRVLAADRLETHTGLYFSAHDCGAAFDAAHRLADAAECEVAAHGRVGIEVHDNEAVRTRSDTERLDAVIALLRSGQRDKAVDLMYTPTA